MFVFGTTVSEHLAAVPPPQEREEDIGVRRSVDDRKNELDHDYQILRAITDASASSTSGNQLQEPTANVRLENVFPALTNEGERPLETGLQRGNHMLPIFQLPRVAKDAPLANTLPKEPTEEEKERLQAELDARAQARSHLGLSEDEVKYFDAVLKNGPSAPLPLPLPQASSTSDVDARKAARKGAKRNKRSISTKSLTNPREPQTSTVSSAVALRKELSTSIKSVQSLTNLVQDGVAALQREYPGAARTAKSKALVQRWGIAKLDQAIQRKRLAKRKVEAMRVHQRRERACLMVQRAYRSRLARKRMAERRVEYAKELEVKERCALRLQAVYRGHRGRLVYQLKSHARRAAQEHDAQQVSKIQSLFRGKKGRRKAAERRKEYLEEMCVWARAWVEEFDETTNDYVFRNLHTQEVYAEPPPDGYTKRDGMLALLDGRVLEDPVIVARREREKNLLQCIECDETAATRKCVECDDIYCDDCFDAIHLKGALASHAFEWFQDGGPQEADPADLAAAGSASADGGLVGAGAAPDWIELFDEESGYPYWYDQTTGVTTWEMPPEFAQQQDVGPYDAAAGAEGMEGGSEWATYFDEASGQNYMYNATTGECIWEHEQQEQPHQDEGNVVYDENTGYPQEQDDGYGYY
ncbi:Rho GTPase-activating protein 27 [Hondaea fermentalgiana]|uniref:Rho GTPase-activating protein 27 n=1 Tax=Hondaea fermentalgiana TaxID=2315210 RepID=A0A2R5G8M2_9STRA|nr:Rho GTPase-activating protein 27 [Hondaea fermentalgiana]|eukprot:GBG26128.1 Rho GTPase-activating protein 27 [Hondaea fermentalgiana]